MLDDGLDLLHRDDHPLRRVVRRPLPVECPLPAPAHGSTPTSWPKPPRSRFRERFELWQWSLRPLTAAARLLATSAARNFRLPYPQLGELASGILSPPAVTLSTQGILPKTNDDV
jgi:hypothetical protein